MPDAARQPTVPDEAGVIVIGGGPAGEIAAGNVAKGGLSAILVERELFGGECSYWACIPSKLLLRPLDLAHATRQVEGVSGAEVDAAATFVRRDRISKLDDSGQADWVAKAGVTPVRGEGRLTGERRVEVRCKDGTVRTLRATHAVVLATGSEPNMPDVSGLTDIAPWTNREATRMEVAPRRLLVIGGGPVAVEMAHAARGLGSSAVTMLVKEDRLLSHLETFAGEMVLAAYRDEGIDVRLNASATKFARVDGGVAAVLDDGATVEIDQVLVAAGRSPRLRNLGLAEVGLSDTDRLQVDRSMRVEGADWLYACGDVNGEALLTHMGKYQARVAAEAIVARAKGSGDGGPRAQATGPTTGVVFCDPQVASVGVTEAAARRAGQRVRAVDCDLAAIAGGRIAADRYKGRARLVIDSDRCIILGATFVGPDIAELLHAATIAVAAAIPLDALWHAVPCFPTVSEAWLKLIEAALDPGD